MPPPLDATLLAIVRDDLRLTTWLLLGACLQSLLLALAPVRLAVLPAAVLLGARILRTCLMLLGIAHDTTQDKVVRGRYTSQFPTTITAAATAAAEKEQSNGEDFVVFIIGARSNHPLSRFAPGFLQAGEFFQSMWKEAEANREKWGYLGRSSDMLATDDETGNAIITLSYWKSMQQLHEFARSPVHRAGWEWFDRMTKTHPHLSMMHEVYAMPKGHWENVYKNFTPFGMGQIQHLVQPADGDDDAAPSLASNLTPAVGSRWKTMGARMAWQGKLD